MQVGQSFLFVETDQLRYPFAQGRGRTVVAAREERISLSVRECFSAVRVVRDVEYAPRTAAL